MMHRVLGAAVLAALTATTAWADVPNDAETLAPGARIDNNSFDRAQLATGNQV